MKLSFAFLSSLRPQLFAVALAASALTAALLPGQVRAASPGPMKVAIVDMRRAVIETEDGLRAQSSLRKYFDRRQGELNARQDELMRKKEDLEKQSKVLSQAALQRALEDWQKQMGELQSLYADYDREMQRRQGEVTAPIVERMSGLMHKLAVREGYDVVLERQAVPYARVELDVTDQLIVMYNGGEDGLTHAPAAPIPSAAPAGSTPLAAPPMAARRAPSAEPGVVLPKPLSLDGLVERLGGSVDEGARGATLSRVVSPWSPHDAGCLLPVLRQPSCAWAEQATGVLLLPPSLAERVPSGRRWVHEQPAWVLAEVLTLAEPAPPPDERALALIEPGAEVHESARVGAYCVIRRGASIGEHCVLEPHVVVYGGVHLGRHVHVGAHAVLGRPGFGWAAGPTGMRRMPQLGGVEIEDEVEIGPCATIDAGTLGPTRLGRGCKLDAHVHVGHNVQIGAHSLVAAQSGFAGSSTIGRGVLVGGQVGVADHLDIGDGARLAARSGVIGDVSAGATVAGYPAVDHQRWLRGMASVLSKSKRRRP